MHNEIVSWIQSHYAADGVEVRATGPKAITLVLPQEMHDLGNFCGELELHFNARIDIVAQTTPGLGPTATVWVAQDDGRHDFNDADDDDDDDRADSDNNNGANDNGSPTDSDKSYSEGNDPVVKQQSKWFQWAAMAVTTAAAVLTILRHGSAMMDGLPDVWQTRSDL